MTNQPDTRTPSWGYEREFPYTRIHYEVRYRHEDGRMPYHSHLGGALATLEQAQEVRAKALELPYVHDAKIIRITTTMIDVTEEASTE